MADIGYRDACLAVDLALERKQYEHVGYGSRNSAQARAAPGPDGRADVMHGGHARSLEAILEIEVEVGRVDPDEQLRTLIEQPGSEAPPDSHDFAIVPQDLDISSHGQLLHR